MSNDEKKELLSNLKQLQKLAKDLPFSTSRGFCTLIRDSYKQDDLDLKTSHSLLLFILTKTNKLGKGYLFPVGQVKKRMEWLQVEIEKLEACIY